MSSDKGTERRLRRARRHARILKTVRGTGYRPRLVVSRSHKNTEGQIVDDDRGETIVGASTRSDGVEQEIPDEMEGKVAEAFAAGMLLARRARDEGVETVVFDRAGYPYHGRVRAFAEGAREGGLEF